MFHALVISVSSEQWWGWLRWPACVVHALLEKLLLVIAPKRVPEVLKLFSWTLKYFLMGCGMCFSFWPFRQSKAGAALFDRKGGGGLKIIISRIKNELQKHLPVSLTLEFSGFLQQMLPPGRSREGALFLHPSR